jgi:tryptophanase
VNPNREGNSMAKVTFFSGQQLPLEMHKVRIIQKLNQLPIQ